MLPQSRLVSLPCSASGDEDPVLSSGLQQASARNGTYLLRGFFVRLHRPTFEMYCVISRKHVCILRCDCFIGARGT